MKREMNHSVHYRVAVRLISYYNSADFRRLELALRESNLNLKKNPNSTKRVNVFSIATSANHFDSTLFQTLLPKIVEQPTLELSIAYMIRHKEKGLKQFELHLRILRR